MQLRESGELAERLAHYLGTQAGSSHPQQQHVRKLRVAHFCRKVSEAPDIFLLFSDDIKPPQPLIFAAVCPQRGIAGPKSADLTRGLPIIKSSLDDFRQVVWQREVLQVDVGCHNATAPALGRVRGTRCRQMAEAFSISGPGDTTIGNDRGDEFIGGDIESEVVDLHPVRGELMIANVSDFLCAALLDGNVFTRRRVEIYG